MTARCITGCGARAVQRHHVLYRQLLRREGGDPDDDRNLVDVCLACHGGQHGRANAIRLAVLPDSVFEFAAELLGAPAAYEYLARFYAGDDPRLDALIEGEAR